MSCRGSLFMGIATNDVVTHGWDLAKATGQPYDVGDDLAEQLRAHMQPFADPMRGPDGQGAFGPEVAVGDGASALDRLVAYLGRRP